MIHRQFYRRAQGVAVALLVCASVSAAQSPATSVCNGSAPDADARIARIAARVFPSVLLRDDTTPRALADRMRALNVPGVQITVIDGDRIAWSRGFGVRDASGAPVTTQTRFQAASLSKPIASLGVLRLVADGRLGLDDDVRRHLRSVALAPTPFLDSGTVTPRLLLSHRAGVAVSGFLGYPQGEAVPTLAQIIAGAKPANHPALVVDAVPGRDNRYSGGGYTVMEQVLEDVSGQPFPAYLAREVLAPLGMTRSTYETLSPDAPDDIARGHHGSGQPLVGGWRTHPEHAAASLWTTSCDYAQAILAMQRAARGGSSPLDARLVREMMTLQAREQGIGVGLKGAPTPFRFSHTGSNVGYKAIMLGYLDAPRGAVVLTNGDNGSELMNEIVRAIAEEYGWNDMRPAIRTAVALDSAEAAPLVGRYEVTPQRAYELTWRDGSLWAAPSGRAPQRLHAMAGDSLGFFFDAELFIWPIRDANRRVTGIRWGAPGNAAEARRVRP
ncbi:MAG: beta-lactamase family protein [Gemmatimonadaceae bacterium]|nr:beta-lactamase family protein [Gemmatimonadaceae bacterium]